MTMPLFDLAERQMAPASLEAFAHILPTLSERQVVMFLRVCDYLDATGYQDVTGGELADWCHLRWTTTRPRLHDLVELGWLQSGDKRPSRAGELRCHPVSPAVPRAAIERLRSK